MVEECVLRSVAWKHHESQNDDEEKDGVQEQAERCRATRVAGNGKQESAKHLLNEFERLGVGNEEEDERRVKTVLGFQGNVHLRAFLVLRADFLLL